MSAPGEPPADDVPVGDPPAGPLHTGPARAMQPRNPLHGVTLERMLTELAADLGWVVMGRRIPIRCFTQAPSVKSSLAFLRRTPWARARVEALFLERQRTTPACLAAARPPK